MLAAIAAQQVIEGQTLTLDLAGNDPDGRSDLLTYAFTSPVPPGLTIDSRTGQIRWVTGEADGGRAVPVAVKVTDRGFPAQTATRSFVITVLEENKPPVLDDVSPQRVAVGDTLTVALRAQDADLPVQTLAYRFTTAPPVGMTIHALTGVITWQPLLSDADRTVLVSVTVADAGAPVQEAMVSFPVTVEPAFEDRPPQFYAIPVHLWLLGTTRSLEVGAFDPDGDGVTMALNAVGLPGGLSFASTPGTGRGVITWNTGGVTPGLYSLPVQATARDKTAAYAPRVKVVPDNLYWQWASGTLDKLDDAAKSDPTSNADGDSAANVLEWALLRNPLSPDETPFNFALQAYEGGWLAAELNLHRRRGSNQFVTLAPQFAGDLESTSWGDVPTTDLEVFLDPFGDRDSDPDSEEVLFRVWLNPADAVARKFFRVKAGTRALLP